MAVVKVLKAKLLFGVSALAPAFVAHAQETRLPIISRVELKYSVVSHYNNRGSRVNFYNENGGNTNYAVPHLVYELIVTLYNPYNTTLTLPKCRVCIANPPVGFKFRKNEVYLRPEWENDGPFLGLGRFQVANESKPAAQKTITLLLRGPAANPVAPPSGSIVLQPGEAVPFAVWVESNWTWGLETATGSRAFFDYQLSEDLTNKDKRTRNLFGVETLRGQALGSGFYSHDFRAGFQTDNLSIQSGRPAATFYPFETNFDGTSWVAIKLNDTFRVEARGVDTVQDPAVPDYQLSLMAGTVQNPATDMLKSYSFTIADLDQAATPTPQSPVINRLLRVGDLLQKPDDQTMGGKTPIASFVMAARSKALQQKKFHAEIQPPANELYETRLEARADFYDPISGNGPSDHPQDGVLVTGIERLGEVLMLDVAAEPRRFSARWKVIGGSDPGEMTTDLTSVTEIMEGPEGAGIYKLRVTLPSGMEKYFVKLAW
ncbi:MAG: hypothetical protein EOP88_16385 [Verrucomicrobiaceae bacterium]|nr:MAG: hypothetical protein EOP88_16385 [Verrucomicrobiaceae bacterium]